MSIKRRQNKIKICNENGRTYMRSENLSKDRIFNKENFAMLLVNKIIEKEDK